jgi:hypothetical protein
MDLTDYAVIPAVFFEDDVLTTNSVKKGDYHAKLNKPDSLVLIKRKNAYYAQQFPTPEAALKEFNKLKREILI